MLELALMVLLSVGTERVAELKAKALADVCEAYNLDPSNNGYPKLLANLVKPQGGGPSITKNGAADLLDPWGNPYKYEVAANEKGDMTPYVWTERIVNGKTKVIGQKPPPKKQ